MSYSLRQLEAQLHKTVVLTTNEIETGEGDCKGHYVWRSEDGEKYFWSLTPQRYAMDDVDSVAEADGIMFLCPACFAKNGGAVGTHSVLVSFEGRNVPDGAGSRGDGGKPTRWAVSSSSLDDLVLTPSILLGSSQPVDQGCHWHGFVGSNGIAPGHAG